MFCNKFKNSQNNDIQITYSGILLIRSPMPPPPHQIWPCEWGGCIIKGIFTRKMAVLARRPKKEAIIMR